MKAPKLCLLQGEKKERRKICIKIIDKNCKNILNAKRMIKLQRNNYKDKYNLLCYDGSIKRRKEYVPQWRRD